MPKGLGIIQKAPDAQGSVDTKDTGQGPRIQGPALSCSVRHQSRPFPSPDPTLHLYTWCFRPGGIQGPCSLGESVLALRVWEGGPAQAVLGTDRDSWQGSQKGQEARHPRSWWSPLPAWGRSGWHRAPPQPPPSTVWREFVAGPLCRRRG